MELYLYCAVSSILIGALIWVWLVTTAETVKPPRWYFRSQESLRPSDRYPNRPTTSHSPLLQDATTALCKDRDARKEKKQTPVESPTLYEMLKREDS